VSDIAELTEALQHRTLSLFIGADLPRNVTGLPSRTDLACDLARRQGLDESLPLAEVAQRVSRAGNRWEFTAFIRDSLDTAGRSPQPFHRRIAALVQARQMRVLITTAYDNLLELTLREAGVPFNLVVRGSDVNFMNSDRPTLIKLYGSAQQPDTLIVTDRDHSDLLHDREREPVLDEVRRALRLNTVLFVGYSLADPNFRFLFDQIAESRFARTAYAVWPRLPEEDVRMWRDRGIAILNTDPLGILGEPGMVLLPSRRPGQAIAAPASQPLSQSTARGDSMDYERGLEILKAQLERTNRYDEFNVLEARLLENLREERLYGPSEQNRSDRARIIGGLNRLALDVLGVSFNQLY